MGRPNAARGSGGKSGFLAGLEAAGECGGFAAASGCEDDDWSAVHRLVPIMPSRAIRKEGKLDVMMGGAGKEAGMQDCMIRSHGVTTSAIPWLAMHEDYVLIESHISNRDQNYPILL